MTEPIYRDDSYAVRCRATVVEASTDGVVLDRTVLYPAGGGQPGDMGVLELPDGTKAQVIDTVRSGESDRIVHVLSPGTVPLAVGTEVCAEMDWERRYAHMRYHTCLHLLCAIVPAQVTGGRIAADKAHLDFDIDMAQLDKDLIEARLNELISAGTEVRARWIDDSELDANPGLVRTMSVAPPRGTGRVRLVDVAGVDLQPCGGTHVRNTREIGAVEVVRIRNEGKRNKRVTIAFR